MFSPHKVTRKIYLYFVQVEETDADVVLIEEEEDITLNALVNNIQSTLFKTVHVKNKYIINTYSISNM